MIRSAATSRATSDEHDRRIAYRRATLNRRVLSRRRELARFRKEHVRIHCSIDQLGAEPRGTHLRRDGDNHDRWPLDGELTDTLHPSPRAFRPVVPEHDGEGLAGVAHVNALARARRSPNQSARYSAPSPLRLSRSEPVRPEYVHPREHATRLALVDSDLRERCRSLDRRASASRTAAATIASSFRLMSAGTRTDTPSTTKWTVVSYIACGDGRRTSTSKPAPLRFSCTAAAKWASAPLRLSTTTRVGAT